MSQPQHRVSFTIVAARRYIARVRWKYAHTMPSWPHWYTVRHWQPELDQEFDAFVMLIRRRGELRYWPVHRRQEIKPYLDVDGWEYWTVGDPIGICQVINRAVIPEGPHPGKIPRSEIRAAREKDRQRGRRVRLIRHRPYAGRRRAPGARWTQSIDELPAGIEGTVMLLEKRGAVHVRWDDLSRTILVPGKDEWEWIT